ncbi:hypothetical protein [Roseinatronobacter alkalisoli]|uniref:Uncharacterized protein n=1 Tax=Roseinatronobacter alkalisoli TaxID=3028235 RepID=A0ABT5TGE6_9RHOB|nr:hypothetical protein [Roseinatronobacter sp. HJB301]MDD7973247.1 hypothetical protein [Roseinatronobacter sp. HJB301]
MFSLPNWLRQKPHKIDKPKVSTPGKPDSVVAPSVGTNIYHPDINLYRTHITAGDCLIVTGYQDFLSSLAVLMKEVKDLRDPEANTDLGNRISFGIDTAVSANGCLVTSRCSDETWGE